MTTLLILYVHLLATCVALGVIVVTDLRLMGELARYPAPITPPTPFTMRIIAAALVLLLASGGALLWIGLDADDNYLNPKLQAKLVLVGLLTLNSIVLHRLTFPRLARSGVVSPRVLKDVVVIALPTAASNALWMFCAFLGIARPWNNSMSLPAVLGIAAVLLAMFFAIAMLVLVLASRSEQARRPDWIDGVKSRLRLLQTALDG